MAEQPQHKTFNFSSRRKRPGEGGPKPKDFNYHIRIASESETKSSKYNFRVYKQRLNEPFNPEEALSTYRVWGDDEVGLICDCPASMYHHLKEGETKDKHVIMVEEFIEGLEAGLTPEAYYCTEDERMHWGDTPQT